MAQSFVPVPRSAPTVVTGQRSFIDTTTQRVIADVSDKIIFWEPDWSPLTVLTAGFKGKRKTTQYSFDQLEKEPYPRESVVSGAQTSGDTSIEVRAGEGARTPNYALLINRRTREVVWVSSVATDTLTVTRAIGGGGAAMDDGDVLEFIGTAFEDGASKGSLKSVAEVRSYNLTQIFRHAFGFTGRQENTDLYGGKDPVTEARQAAIDHRKAIELAMFFGKRHDTTGPNGKKLTMMGGLEYFIRTNVWDLNGNEPTDRQMVEFMEHVMRWGQGGHNFGDGGATKWLFASPRWMTIIESWARDKIEYTTVDKKVGLKVGTYQTIHGTLKIVRHPLFVGEHGSYAFLADMNHLKYAYHQGRDTKLVKNIQANDVDGMEHEYMTDCSLQVDIEASHALLKNVSI